VKGRPEAGGERNPIQFFLFALRLAPHASRLIFYD
jgi:hypothetical protein